MSLQRVQPGDPLSSISARGFNDIVAHVKDALTPKDVQRLIRRRDQSIVHILNNTGGDLKPFDVVGLDGAHKAAYSGDDILLRTTPWDAVSPAWDAHRGRAAVVVNAVASGDVGYARVAGVTRVRIEFGAEGPMPRADILVGNTDKLRAGTTGNVVILEASGTAGEQWCVVRLGASATTRVEARIHTPVPDGSNRWTYSATIGAFNEAGLWVDGAVTVMARNRRERLNTGAGVEGSGVDEDGLTGTFTHVSVGEIIAALEGPYDVAGAPFFYFESANQTDGACE